MARTSGSRHRNKMSAIEGNRTVGERGGNRRSWPEPAARGGKSANRECLVAPTSASAPLPTATVVSMAIFATADHSQLLL
jgi:hypothetical protein